MISAFARRRPARRVLPTAAMLLACTAALLGGCAGAGPAADAPPVGLAEATRRVVVNYLLAHGMAESYVMSGRASEKDLLRLVQYDKAALAAISGAASQPGWAPVRAADAAVQALVAYTTRHDAGPPEPGTARARRAGSPQGHLSRP